jgi:hypothetical protein
MGLSVKMAELEAWRWNQVGYYGNPCLEIPAPIVTISELLSDSVANARRICERLDPKYQDRERKYR